MPAIARTWPLLLILVATSAAAQETIDGRFSGTYGPADALQANNTSLGDNTLIDGYHANGSEMVAAHAVVRSDSLYLFLRGNLQDNGTILELFIDCIPGGQNVLLGNNANVDGNGLNRLAGLTFDAGFAPDFYFTMSCSDVSIFSVAVTGHFAELPTAGGGAGVFLGTTNAGGYATGSNSKRIEFTLRNDSGVGVGAGCVPATDNGGVASGMEILIPLTSLGSPGACILMTAFINRPGHSSIGNQVLASLPPGSCDLGEPSQVNFASIAGEQFFSECSGTTPLHRSTWGSLKTLYR